MAVPSTILDLSTTAASNSPAGSETVGPNLDNYLRAIEAIVRQESENKRWERYGHTPTYISASSFSVTGDQTALYTLSLRLKCTVSGSDLFGTITGSSFGAGITTVTVALDSGSLTAGLTEVQLGITDFATTTVTLAGTSTKYAITPAGLAALLLPLQSGNFLINGDAEVTQGTSATLTTSAQYGNVDMVTGWASGGAVSAGTVTNDAAAPIGRTGNAFKLSGVTMTGSGQLSWRYRMEAKDALKLKNATALFQIKVQHDVGSSVNYTTVLRKPTAADNYAATTTIATSSATSVASGTATTLTPFASGQALGDVSNGLEIEIQVACGAVTTKNFWFTEWQLNEGTVARAVEYKSYVWQLAACQRYYEVLSTGFSGATVTTTVADFTAQCMVEKRTTPTIAQVDTAPSIRIGGSTTADIAGTISNLSVDTRSVYVQFTRTSGTWTANLPAFINQSSAWLSVDARL